MFYKLARNYSLHIPSVRRWRISHNGYMPKSPRLISRRLKHPKLKSSRKSQIRSSQNIGCMTRSSTFRGASRPSRLALVNTSRWTSKGTSLSFASLLHLGHYWYMNVAKSRFRNLDFTLEFNLGDFDLTPLQRALTL